MRYAIALLVCLVAISCASKRQRLQGFKVVPAKPEYLLQTPDSAAGIPFPEILAQFNRTNVESVDLRRPMYVRVENAYFREGMPKRGLANFVGTEVVRYRVTSSGTLQEQDFASKVEVRPADQMPVQQLFPESRRRFRSHRYFYQVLVNRRGSPRSAVVLSADSAAALDRLTRQLLDDPESVCGADSRHCTVFPEACTVALEFEVDVNGKPRILVWGSTLMNVAPRDRSFELRRVHAGKLKPVSIDRNDPQAMRLPLMPGDEVRWQE